MLSRFSESMREAYLELYALNRDLITQYNIRCSNHDELLANLKVSFLFIVAYDVHCFLADV
jgi:hypothetical protein